MAVEGTDRYKNLEQIGEGKYGPVFKARDIETGESVALKRIQVENEEDVFPLTVMREIEILKKLDHDHVIKLKEVVRSQGPEIDEQRRPDDDKHKVFFYLVFEYMDHDLLGLIDQYQQKFTAPEIKCYIKQLLTALRYCAINKIVHHDLQESNILINNEGILKLADFGLAKSSANLESGSKVTDCVIALWYRPPELLLGTSHYGSVVDMWSAGCIFARLLTGKHIFPGINEVDQVNKIYDLYGKPDDVNWPGVSKMRRHLGEVCKDSDIYAMELLERMLTLDPAQRITAKDALEAEYFRTDPLPCDPKSLPKYPSSHYFKTRNKCEQEEQLTETVELQSMLSPNQSSLRSHAFGLLIKVFQGWNPLGNPSHGLELISLWKVVLRVRGGLDIWDVGPYYDLLISEAVLPAVLPAVRISGLYTWQAQDPEPMLRFMELWENWLPSSVLTTILDEIVMPKLHIALFKWQPRSEANPIHMWLHPWLPFRAQKIRRMFPCISFKMGIALNAWHPSDGFAYDMLSPWKSRFDSETWEHLIHKFIVPKLQIVLQEFQVNPADQKFNQFCWVIKWTSAIPNLMVEIMEKLFFPKWLEALYHWLSSNPNIEEVEKWYFDWKELIPQELLARESIRCQLICALKMMNQAVEGKEVVQPGLQAAAQQH